MSSSLSVPGATIAYQTKGSGPLLLLITGASGDGGVWQAVAPFLATTYTVCTYARRGFSASRLTDQQDLTMPTRLRTDADDAARLIRHLSPAGQPAFVLGSSSGAIVALELLRRHPEAVRRVVAHEPPLTQTLGQKRSGEVQAWYAGVIERYRSGGMLAAVGLFGTHVVSPGEEAVAKAMADPAGEPNFVFFLDNELLAYTSAELDFAAISQHRARLIMACGRSTTDPMFKQIAEKVAQKVEAPLQPMIGAHFGFFAVPEEFANELKVLLPPQQ